MKFFKNLFGRKNRELPDHAFQIQDTNHSDKTVEFGGVGLRPTEASVHFMYVGAPGSGKTTGMKRQMGSVLPNIVPGANERALIYDAKSELMALLPKLCPNVVIKTTDPFDARGVAWDLCRDVVEPRVAVEIAFTLMPKESESQPFFSDAARHLLYGVMISYMQSKIEWTFADLVRGVKSARQLKAILKRHSQTEPLIGQYFYDRRLLSNIMSTIATKMLPYEPIAACWDHATEKISLEEWSRSEFVLLLGNSETSRNAIEAINRCLFKRGCDITLHQPETLRPHTWFFIDEVSEAGRLDGLVSLLKKGRSKGASVTIAFQSISGLRDAQMYGPYFTDEILGQIGNRFFGRLECPETAEWASKLFGDQEIDQFTVSSTSSSQGGSTTTSQQVVTRRAVLPAEFMSVPPCTKENGLTAYFMVRSLGCYQATLPGEMLFDDELEGNGRSVPEFVPRPTDAQYLRIWTDEEKQKFGAVAPPKKKPRPPMEDLDDMNDL